MVERLHAGFDRLLSLRAHIDGARGIFPDQHDRETRLQSVLGAQPLYLRGDLRAQVRCDCLAVDDACGHGGPLKMRRIFYPARAIFSSAAPSAAASPDTFTRLMRDVAPPTISTRVGGTPSALARTRPNAAFASPSNGAARTRTFSTVRPSGHVSIPSTESRPPFGVSRTVTIRPSGCALHAAAAPLTERRAGCRAR